MLEYLYRMEKGGDIVLALFMAIENEDDRSIVMELYEKHAKYIYLYARKYIDHQYSQDCVHDVMEIVINQLEKIKALCNDMQLKFMIICARNTIFNKYNFKKLSFESLFKYNPQNEEEYELEIIDDSPSSYEIYINDCTRAKLRELVNQLDLKYRDVIILRYEYELSCNEIATELCLTSDTVRKRIERGLKIIRKLGGAELYDLFKK